VRRGAREDGRRASAARRRTSSSPCWSLATSTASRSPRI
jgi:hypothetical protein